jgi:hypothetical protein
MCLIVLKCMWLYWPVFIIKRVYRILQERVKPLGSLKRYTTIATARSGERAQGLKPLDTAQDF